MIQRYNYEESKHERDLLRDRLNDVSEAAVHALQFIRSLVDATTIHELGGIKSQRAVISELEKSLSAEIGNISADDSTAHVGVLMSKFMGPQYIAFTERDGQMMMGFGNWLLANGHLK